MFAKNIYLIHALDFHIKYIFLYIKNIYLIYIKYIWQFFLCTPRKLIMLCLNTVSTVYIYIGVW